MISQSIGRLEERVAKNTAELEQMSRSYGDDDDDDYDDYGTAAASQPETVDITDDDIARELEEIRELEQRKQALEDRVSGMERDLGGLMR